jgi:hypothetical protein
LVERKLPKLEVAGSRPVVRLAREWLLAGAADVAREREDATAAHERAQDGGRLDDERSPTRSPLTVRKRALRAVKLCALPTDAVQVVWPGLAPQKFSKKIRSRRRRHSTRHVEPLSARRLGRPNGRIPADGRGLRAGRNRRRDDRHGG